jgi:hypothetical protein
MLGGLGLHIGAMFPLYSGGGPSTAQSVLSMPDETAVYICLEVGWALAALLVLSRISVRGGVAVGAGLAAVEVGLLITDVANGLTISNGSAPGVWLAVAGLCLGSAGVLFGAGSVPMGSPRLNPDDGTAVTRVTLTLLVAVVAVAAFWPSWDQFRLVGTSGGTETVTNGNVFSLAPGPMAGGVLTGLAIGLVVIVASFWAPPEIGGWLTTGVLIALSSQIISGYVQLHEPLREVTGTINGVNLAQSSLTLTGYWTTDVAATIALAALALWAGVAGRRLSSDSSAGSGAVPDRAVPDRAAAGPSTESDWPSAHHWPRT